MMDWYNVIAFADLPADTMVPVVAGEKQVIVLKRDNAVHAFAATCPHASAPLCDGWLDAQGRVVCPLHKYRFDPANGRNTSGEGYKLKTYPTRIEDGQVFIGILA